MMFSIRVILLLHYEMGKVNERLILFVFGIAIEKAKSES